VDQYLGDKAKYAKGEIEKYYQENHTKLVEYIEKAEMPQSFVRNHRIHLLNILD
jgi:hypothetical protein